MSVGELGNLSTVEYSTDSGTTWVAVPNVKSIEPPVLEFTDIETSNLSTTGGVKVYRPGALAGHSELTFEHIYDPTSYAAIYALYGLDSTKWRVTLHGATTSKTYTFFGFLKKYAVKVAGEDQLNMVTGTVRMTAAPTLA